MLLARSLTPVFRGLLGASLAISAALPLQALAQEAAGPGERPRTDPAYTWDLTHLYPSVESWEQARQEVLAALRDIEAKKGTLGDSPEALLAASSLISETLKKAGRVSVYATLSADEDLRLPETQERRQLAQTMFNRFSEATAWYQPEVLRVGRDKIMGFVDQDPRLERFRYRLDDILRNAPHTLGDEAERVLAAAGQPLGAAYNVYGLLANSDIPWPTITLSTGEKVRLDSQGYSLHRQAENRGDRKRVFDAFWGKWREFQNSVGMTLNSHLQAQVFLSRARKHESVLERELFQDNIPPAVYRTLVEEVNRALPTLHRYFKLRERMLGIDQMHYYDIYPPLVSLEKEFTVEDAKTITLEAMSVLGDDWVEMQRDAINQRWMHVFPQQGKRSGAYMNGFAYDVHPYLLLNFNDDYESVSTFAHEWGHAMHTLYAKQRQPFETASYATFIAEIPSTTLELILQHYMVENARSKEEKLYYLGTGLEQLRGTFFRQTMFAEFELALYEAVERGEALSGRRISEIYGEILKRYHGHDDGVVVVDDLYSNEWMFVPHFYFNMYVYQYATSLAAGTAMYEKIRSEGGSAVENFKNLLRAGGSDYPYRLLLDAGVDMAKPEPYRALVKRMNEIMDEMEALLEDG
ncbi:MAG: oligoendopeptidase F [Gemmatimonadota bacterium]